MDQEFIRLMQILLGNPIRTIESSSHKLNPDYAKEINDHVDTLNTSLGIKPCEDSAFIGEAPCNKKLEPNSLICNLIEKPNHPTIGPVPFASSGDKPAFAFIGLNPLFDKKNNSGCEEKIKAGNLLGDYAAFYNSKSCTPNGIFPFIFNPLGKYYRNIFILIYSLCKGEFRNWDSISPNRKTKEDKIAISNTYLELITKCPIIVPELIPFHSSSTKISIDTLYHKIPIYRHYHSELLKVLDNKLHPEGIIFVHGKASSDAITGQMSDNLRDIEKFPKEQKTTHKIGIWEGRVVVILSSFVGSRNGAFCTNDEIKDLIYNILQYISLKNKKIPCNCNNMKLSAQDVSPKILVSQSSDSNKDLEQIELSINVKQEDDNQVRKRRRRGEVGIIIEAFTDDTKGLRAGDSVLFPESRKKGAEWIEGKIDHIFFNSDTTKQEAKIIVDDGTKYGKKYYRELHEIEKADK